MIGNYCIKPVEEKEKDFEKSAIKEAITNSLKYYDKRGNVVPKEEWEKIWSEESVTKKKVEIEDYIEKECELRYKNMGNSLNNNKNNINHPEYYISNGIEVIEVIEAFNLNFHLGNAIKYVLRAGKKNTGIIEHNNFKEDIQKAIWYLNRSIK